MLSQTVLNVMARGIKVKLLRGEDLEETLSTYVKLTEEEKQQIREVIETEVWHKFLWTKARTPVNLFMGWIAISR